MTTLVYDDAAFRAFLPYFADTTKYPEAALQQFFNNATSFVSAENCGDLRDGNRQNALYYMTAHLAALTDIIVANNGAAPGMIVNAKIDKVQVQLQPPPAKNEFHWWLMLTPWGQALLGLLKAASVGGWSVGGMPERLGFRRVGGGFGGFR